MIDPAIREFAQTVGEPHVIAGDSAALRRYSWCTLPLTRQIAAVVRPGSVQELQQVVGLASRRGIALYPISTGNNWGYGTALPVRDDNVIVDLGRLNRIVEVNATLAYAVVEPGVTQRQLAEHLRSQRLPLWINPTGAGPHCSVLGNTLERGFGIGPNGDHFLAQCGMEVVLPSGELLQTGFGHFPGARATHVYKWGVGPYLDGLFTQSNLGIVTKIGVWLEPAPDAFEACYFTCNREEQIGPLVEALRRLLFARVFVGPVNLLHRNRVLIMFEQYPWNEMQGRTPLAEPVAARMAAERRIGAWNGVGAISGTRHQVRAARKAIREAFRGIVDRAVFLSERRLQVIERYPNVFSRLTGTNVANLLKAVQNSFRMMQGVPTEVALSLAYWRNRRPMPANDPNPARDNCGLMWFAPIIPMTADDVAEFRRTVEPILSRYGFDTCITLTAVNERCFDCTLPLLYDKDDPGESTKVQDCYAEVSAECRRKGFIAYRLGLQSMAQAVSGDDVFWQTVGKIKGALDPQQILAPGRYAP